VFFLSFQAQARVLQSIGLKQRAAQLKSP